MSPRIAPALARLLLKENIEKIAHIIPLSVSDYKFVVNKCNELGMSGGIIYDGLILHAGRKVKTKHLLTLNKADFSRLWPDDTKYIITP